jgi:two-component system, chemotaxis family, chemotaxis protein CheY
MPSHVLIVDDDPVTRQALALLLTTQGYTVAEAADGAAALARLRTGDLPRLVLLDLMMPVMDGWHFLNERQRRPALGAVPVLVLTAARGIDSPALRAMGAEDILQKPIAPEDVVAAVSRYC